MITSAQERDVTFKAAQILCKHRQLGLHFLKESQVMDDMHLRDEDVNDIPIEDATIQMMNIFIGEEKVHGQ